ncbi:hypothetical protein M378DRAFT_192767 [Amanita muscaria Koide BX008]|uniref:Uncharacterized protein n=1 Tax=Amanita muscaria (strain Koide BX008) TaxID=946122 RepID=A0A0C2TBF1_AMAMK|nr:hypothetical protein M378DRAFT_192767 [Amanita muscaria Koide BX008]
MFFDLNVPVPSPHTTPAIQPSKKAKGKAPQQAAQPSQQGTSQLYTQAELKAIETRIDLLVHLGYTVLALTQTVHKKVDPKTHTNTLDALVSLLRPRPGILYLKRLSIILDDDSEKGFGLINAHTSLFSSYDLLSLTPTTHGTFSLACLTHTLPSPLTTHIISLPLTLPRFNFYLKHTLIRTALKNGAAFELPYVGSLGGSQDDTLLNTGYAESGPSAKRSWWAAAREVVRVTKGKGIIVTSGSVGEADLRAPRDVANLLTLLGIPQDTAIHSLTSIPKSITIRAQTRRTYRAVLSEPTAVIPEGSMELLRGVMKEAETVVQKSGDASASLSPPPGTHMTQAGVKRPREEWSSDILCVPDPGLNVHATVTTATAVTEETTRSDAAGPVQNQPRIQSQMKDDGEVEPPKKKKRKKNSKPLESSLGL